MVNTITIKQRGRHPPVRAETVIATDHNFIATDSQRDHDCLTGAG